MPASNPVPPKQLRQGKKENAGKFKCFRSPFCKEYICLGACVLSVSAGEGEGSVLGSNNPRLVVHLSPVILN